jgi:hypothetical protein
MPQPATDDDQVECPGWVKNGPDSPKTPFLVYPEQRTSSDRPGMSQRCQKRASADVPKSRFIRRQHDLPSPHLVPRSSVQHPVNGGRSTFASSDGAHIQTSRSSPSSGSPASPCDGSVDQPGYRRTADYFRQSAYVPTGFPRSRPPAAQWRRRRTPAHRGPAQRDLPSARVMQPLPAAP